MQGPDVGDTNAAPVPLRWPREEESRKLRIGYFEDDGRTPVSAETRSAVRTAAEVLRSSGFQVDPFQPEGLEEARQLWWKYFVVAGGMLLRPMFNGRESDLSPILKQFLEWSAAQPAHTGRTLLDAWIRRDALRAQFFAANGEVSHPAVPGCGYSGFSTRRQELADRKQRGQLSRCLELYGIL